MAAGHAVLADALVGEHFVADVLVVLEGDLAEHRQVPGVLTPGQIAVMRIGGVEGLQVAACRIKHRDRVAHLVGCVQGHRQQRCVVAPGELADVSEYRVDSRLQSAHDQVRALVLLPLAGVAMERQVLAVVAEREGAHALDLVVIAGHEVLQPELVAGRLALLLELLAFLDRVAQAERDPVAVGRERGARPVFEHLGRIRGEHAQPQLRRLVHPRHRVRQPATVRRQRRAETEAFPLTIVAGLHRAWFGGLGVALRRHPETGTRRARGPRPRSEHGGTTASRDSRVSVEGRGQVTAAIGFREDEGRSATDRSPGIARNERAPPPRTGRGAPWVHHRPARRASRSRHPKGARSVTGTARSSRPRPWLCRRGPRRVP